jgi:exosortase
MIDLSDAPTASDDAERDPVYAGLRLSAWLQIIAIGSLFVLLFWPNLRRLWYKTNPFNGEPNWGHAVAVPLIGLYYLYVHREQLLAAKVKTEWSGLGIAVGGILFFAYGIYPGQNDWFKDMGMVVTLFGVVTLLCGWRVMKIAWFPILFLICALPWPGLFYSQIASPLQKMAAEVAVHILHLAGVPAGQFGTKIFVGTKGGGVRTLNVAEACAGLRGLMTFVSIASAVAFLSARPMWQKIILVVSAIPIAIFCNTMRVTGQGVLARYASEQWGENFAHGFVGLLMMIPAFFLILLVGWVLEHIFIEEVEDKSGLKRPRPAGAKVTLVAPAMTVVAAPAVGTVRAGPAPRADVAATLGAKRAVAAPVAKPAASGPAETRPAGASTTQPAPRPAAGPKSAAAGARPAGTPPVRPAAVPPIGATTRRPPAARPPVAGGAGGAQSKPPEAGAGTPPQPVRRTIGLPPTIKPVGPKPATAKAATTDVAKPQATGTASAPPANETKEEKP